MTQQNNTENSASESTRNNSQMGVKTIIDCMIREQMLKTVGKVEIEQS